MVLLDESGSTERLIDTIWGDVIASVWPLVMGVRVSRYVAIIVKVIVHVIEIIEAHDHVMDDWLTWWTKESRDRPANHGL